MKLALAFRAFFSALFNAQAAQQIERALAGEPATDAAATSPPTPLPPTPSEPTRNDALALLSTLQREARLVDIVKEPLTEYSDAQVGAAARDVLRDCGKVLDRCFALEPAIEAEEGAEIKTPPEVDAGVYRLTGNVGGDPPYSGRLVHHGWKATRCELPSWSGSEEAARTVAPIELDVA